MTLSDKITGTVTRILHSNLLEVTTPQSVVKVRPLGENEPLPIGNGKNITKFYMNKYLGRDVNVEVISEGEVTEGKVAVDPT